VKEEAGIEGKGGRRRRGHWGLHSGFLIIGIIESLAFRESLISVPFVLRQSSDLAVV
jgi:hypothetical protein